MVFHIPAAAAAIAYLSTHDCTGECDESSKSDGNMIKNGDDETDNNQGQENDSNTVFSNGSQMSTANQQHLASQSNMAQFQTSSVQQMLSSRRRQTVQFSSTSNSDRSAGKIVRMMYSERAGGGGASSPFPSRKVLTPLKSIISDSMDNDGPGGNKGKAGAPDGFVNGDFASGLIENICFDSCWATAFSPRADMLAVGQMGRVDFLETRSFSLICSVHRLDMVSAIQWCSAEALEYSLSIEQPRKKKMKRRGSLSSDKPDTSVTIDTDSIMENLTSDDLEIQSFEPPEKDLGEIVAVAGLDGQVTVYEVHKSLLELQGAQAAIEFFAPHQVRCMALEAFGNGLLVMAIGDKGGKVTISSLARNRETGGLTELYRMGIYRPNDPVLGIALDAATGILAATSHGGSVVAYKLTCGVPSAESTLPCVVAAAEIWRTQRNGPVRTTVINQGKIIFGGYDKTLVWVDINLWAIVREVTFHGTINVIALDPLGRFIAIGDRDKVITLLDTSTYHQIKRFETPGYATTISWGLPGLSSDILAARTDEKVVSIFDLSPIQTLDKVYFRADSNSESSLTWSPDGHFLARIAGDHIRIANARNDFEEVASIKMSGYSIRKIVFCPVGPNEDSDDEKKFVRIAAVGLKGYLQLLEFNVVTYELSLLHTQFVESYLWAVDWSGDGSLIATGGKSKQLHLFSAEKLKKQNRSLQMEGRIWDLSFARRRGSSLASYHHQLNTSCALVVAVGDYKAFFYETQSFTPVLEVVRPRTIRCMCYHPQLPLLAVGDGAGLVAIVDYVAEETTKEFRCSGRVTVLQFSPVGDFLLVGTDSCQFVLYETRSFKPVQCFKASAFAVSAAFSKHGKYLAFGSADGEYKIVRLGPLLGIEYVLNPAMLPHWALEETLYRSEYGPSLVQRQIMESSQESFQWIATNLKKNPDVLLTYNRSNDEGCFDTALRLRKIKILKLALMTLVDGTLEAGNDGRRSILTSNIPSVGRATLETMLENHPQTTEFIVEILKSMTFVRVPFTNPHVVHKEEKMVCGSSKYLDPWKDEPEDDNQDLHVKLMRTPAVLPLPDLGTMDFLQLLVLRAPPTVFDNEAMGIVLRVMWRYHIRRYFIVDFIIFLIYLVCWISLVDKTSAREPNTKLSPGGIAAAFFSMVLNSVYAFKEFKQSDKGRRSSYFRSLWNAVDITSILLIYVYVIHSLVPYKTTKGLVRLSVATSLLLTIKMLSYLRGFHDTGWLVTVLAQNFKDVKGFLVVLLAIVLGFTTSFRSLFANAEPICMVKLDEEGNLSQNCDPEPFGNLRQAFLSTFELTIMGSYDSALIHESPHSFLAGFTFILGVTSILVVALNALISVLADSYARVQKNATANRRKEKAELIVEYMSLLPRRQRRKIEERTKFIHALLEADADGDLVIDTDDWRGGINALRDDIMDFQQEQSNLNRKTLEEFKNDLDADMSAFKLEVLTMLHELQQDVKKIRQNQAEGITLNGKQVVGAVNAVKQIGRRKTQVVGN